MTWKGWAAAVAIVVIAAFFFGRSSVPVGISPADAAQLARRAGDSAIASYSKPISQVIGSLQESVTFYRGKAQAAAKLVVGHQAVEIHDHALVQTSATAPSDTVRLAMPSIDSGGIQLAESLTVSPAPNLILRSLHVRVDPDTIAVALLKTPEGLQRFTAAATAAGVSVRTIDAAATPPPSRHSGARTALTVLTLGGCTLLGVELGTTHTSAPLAIGGGALCAGGAAFELSF